jgi:spermidine/putrescine-binding protein
MKRRTFLLAGAVAAACGRGPRLNVYNWSDYIAPETVPQFEREFGVRIHYGT